MKIGIDARMYGPRQGGLGRYVEQLIKQLEKIDTQNQYVLFFRDDNWEEYQPAGRNFKKVRANIPWYSWAEQLLLPRIIKKEKVDLMHFPHWNVPFFYKEPFVVTIHDLLLLHYPTRHASTLGPVKYFFKNIGFRVALRHAVQKAKKIITVSEFSKKDIVKSLEIAPEKIIVTHLAPLSIPIEFIENKNTSANIFNKFKITKPYILYVGVAFPHKNLEGLLSAWKIFNEKTANKYQLVLSGKENYFYRRLSESRLTKENANLIYTGFTSETELAALYSRASLYVFPSFYEGFGLPPLEAMQYGVPVATANVTSMPEILGNAVIYFNPRDPAEIAKAMKQGLEDQGLRYALINKSAVILKKYSWRETAEKTLKIYQNF